MARRGDLRQTPELSDRSNTIGSVAREGTPPFAALLAAVIVTTLLAACGGSDSDSSSSTERTTAGGATTGSAQGGGDRDDSGARGDRETQSGAQDQPGDGESQSDSQNRQNSSADGDGAQNVATPLQVSGGGSDQFLTKGGDNSIQEYGDEGDESELQEVAEIVHGFYVVRAEEKWEEACSYLAKSNVEQLEQLASQSPQFKDQGCGPILKAFTRPLPAEIQRQITAVDAGSFRHDGEQGFLIYYGSDKTVYAMPLRNEGGTWKVAALSGSAIG